MKKSLAGLIIVNLISHTTIAMEEKNPKFAQLLSAAEEKLIEVISERIKSALTRILNTDSDPISAFLTAREFLYKPANQLYNWQLMTLEKQLKDDTKRKFAPEYANFEIGILNDILLKVFQAILKSEDHKKSFQNERDGIIKLILAGANPNIKLERDSFSSLDLDKKTKKRLKNKYSLLELAAITNDISIVSLFLAYGANPNFKTNGRTVLIDIASCGNQGIELIMDQLIKNGAHVNLQDKYSEETALMYSIVAQNPEAVEILLNNGARVDIQNYRGETAIDYIKNYHGPFTAATAKIMALLLTSK